jgi:hypothetical protein
LTNLIFPFTNFRRTPKYSYWKNDRRTSTVW